MSKRPTHDEAMAALSDPDVPIADALRTFERAFRRSNDVTKGFVLHMCGQARKHRLERPLAPAATTAPTEPTLPLAARFRPI